MEKKTSSREEEDWGSGQQIIIIMFLREKMFSTCMIWVGSLEPVEFLCIIPLNMFIFLSISGMFWLYVEIVNVIDISTKYLQLNMTLSKI